MPAYQFKVDLLQNHTRVDVFLVSNLGGEFTRTFIKKVIDSGGVTVNGNKVKAHYKVCADEIVEITIPESQAVMEETYEPENIPLEFFYQDEYFAVIYKPTGMLVHPVHGCNQGTLVNALLYHFNQLSDVNESHRPGIVHRLDRETSGLILVAKDNRSHVRLARQFEKHRVKKKYVALVKGAVPHDEGVIEASLGRHYKHFDKRAVSFDDKGKEATTFYRVMKRFDEWASLVALYPESGRTHQLRVHMAYIGHPILGDDKYGAQNHFSRLALHAQAIKIKHPQTKDLLEFSCPIPSEFQNPVFPSE